MQQLTNKQIAELKALLEPLGVKVTKTKKPRSKAINASIWVKRFIARAYKGPKAVAMQAGSGWKYVGLMLPNGSVFTSRANLDPALPRFGWQETDEWRAFITRKRIQYAKPMIAA